MFAGIIETTGKIVNIKVEGKNYTFTIESTLAKEAYIDQSIAHDGVCLTVIDINEDKYSVVAIKETLDITNLKSWQKGRTVNLERCMLPNTRLDGHMVQGHVDSIAKCLDIQEADGSWYFKFALDNKSKGLIVNKGSVAINGTSLTVVNPDETSFSVAIIPYTYENTVFKFLKINDEVNIEYDIIGKYVQKQLELREN